MESEEIKNFCRLDAACIDLMRGAVSNLHLSARAYYRIIKVARTISDLEGAENIRPKDIGEAIQYRFKAE
jgi:magnesium chelatase family protein